MNAPFQIAGRKAQQEKDQTRARQKPSRGNPKPLASCQTSGAHDRMNAWVFPSPPPAAPHPLMALALPVSVSCGLHHSFKHSPLGLSLPPFLQRDYRSVVPHLALYKRSGLELRSFAVSAFHPELPLQPFDNITFSSMSCEARASQSEGFTHWRPTGA